MRLLDLFCGEGGAAVGYARAGFDVVGVDSRPACGKWFPYEFHAADALEYLDQHGPEFDAIHASPPCQLYSRTRHANTRRDYPDLVEPTRDALDALGLPYVIENVPGAPLRNPITLCGAAFGLTASDLDGKKLYLRRHRIFESNVYLWRVECACAVYRGRGYAVGGVYGGGPESRMVAKYERQGGYTPVKSVRAKLLGVDWPTTLNGLNQAIPPAYTCWIGEQLVDHLARSA